MGDVCRRITERKSYTNFVTRDWWIRTDKRWYGTDKRWCFVPATRHTHFTDKRWCFVPATRHTHFTDVPATRHTLFPSEPLPRSTAFFPSLPLFPIQTPLLLVPKCAHYFSFGLCCSFFLYGSGRKKCVPLWRGCIPLFLPLWRGCMPLFLPLWRGCMCVSSVAGLHASPCHLLPAPVWAVLDA